MKRRSKLIAGGVVLGGCAALVWWTRIGNESSPCPYEQRFFLKLPRPAVTRQRLREILDPIPGEYVLEIGPGTGYYTLSVAQWLSSDGTVDILDIQRRMIDHTLQRASNRDIDNITATLGNAQNLPYPDDYFDAAYLVATLGEVPNQDQTLGELHRVLRPGGRLVVGEALPDPDMIRFDTLRKRCERIGFEFERCIGSWFGYFAKFRTPASSLAG